MKGPARAAASPTPKGSGAPADEPDNASLAWADEAPPPQRPFGPLGLVAAALLVMVGVYLGAMMLLK